MKNITLFAVLLAFAAILVTCSKSDDRMQSTNPESKEVPVSNEIIAKFKSKGFCTDEIKAVSENGVVKYLIEGCTFVTENELDAMTDPVSVMGPFGEQYRTYNLVSTPYNIKVRGTNLPTKISTALDQAIAKYNSLGLKITFTRVSSGGDIVVRAVSGGAGGYSGFPSNGRPYSSVTIYRGTTSYSQAVNTHVMTHELGHCIGFRHSDYFNRSLSCGTGGNEGAGTVGAVHIPGTTTGWDPGSYMNSCFSTSSNGSFSGYDVTALNQLYK
jgi:hypothetical protein